MSYYNNHYTDLFENTAYIQGWEDAIKLGEKRNLYQNSLYQDAYNEGFDDFFDSDDLDDDCCLDKK